MAGLADDASLGITPHPHPPPRQSERDLCSCLCLLLGTDFSPVNSVSSHLYGYRLLSFSTPYIFLTNVYTYSWRATPSLKNFFFAKALWYLTPHFTANQIGAMQLRCSTVSIETSSVMTGEKGWGLGGAGSPLQRVEWLKPLWMLTVQKNNMPWFGKAQCCNYFLNVRRTHS